ncbi:MAG TPA: glycosyltransferase family 4 protein [Candidatus Competibacter sp.]|nr:glycosyltransferase family 4 protein [Candidatus Competibacter sp.]
MSRFSLPIVIVTPAFPPDRGGLALAAAHLARQLQPHLRLEVVVLGRSNSTAITTFAADGGFPVLRATAPTWAEAQQQAFHLLRERGPYRLLHGIYPSLTGFPVALAARVTSTPFVLAARGNDLHRDIFRSERYGGLLFALQRANAVVGVSRELCQLSVELGATGLVRWIPDGVDCVRFQPVPPGPELLSELDLAAAHPRLGFTGEACPEKGLSTMLQALVLLRRHYPQATLLLIGGVRENARSILAEFLDARPELRSAVRELPWLPQERLAAYYGLLDVFWYPTRGGGSPNAVLEALACEIPVVASRTGGIADILADTPLVSLLVPPDNPPALAETTLRLLRANPEARAELGAAGRDRAMLWFTLNAEAKAYLDLYDEIDNAGMPMP